MLQINSAIIRKIQTLADGSLRLQLDTPELSEAEMISLFTAYKSKDLGIQIDEPRIDNPKTPSERLRGVLYRYWENSKREETFESFYVTEMSRISDHYKSKLP